MKNDSDPTLRVVLNAWKVSPPAAPNFEAVVWRRIAEEGETRGGRHSETLREWIFVRLTKPTYAVALLLVTAWTGVTAGNWRAGHVRDQYRLDSARHYLASIDPMAMTATASPLAR